MERFELLLFVVRHEAMLSYGILLFKYWVSLQNVELQTLNEPIQEEVIESKTRGTSSIDSIWQSTNNLRSYKL